MATTRKNRKSSRKNNTMSGGKRKLNPYMKFVKKNRASIVSSNPKATIPEIGKALGKKWRSLSDAEKKRYA
jgi:hypothetical protein